jgi:ATP-binding cassette subfamily B protein
MTFPYYKQLNEMDCGPTCLRMIAKYYGKHFNMQELRQESDLNKSGVSFLGLAEAAEKKGFRTRGVRLTFEQLTDGARLPCILHWDLHHFVVLTPPRSVRGRLFPRLFGNHTLYIADPATSLLALTKKEFLHHWNSNLVKGGEPSGFALLLEPSPKFYDQHSDREQKLNWSIVLQYLRTSHWQIAQVIIALLIASILQLILPFLTQSVVDNGISTRNVPFVTVILVAQLMLMFSKTVVDFIRSRILLVISIIVNLSILSDFWIKLTRLPLSYFDMHRTGDTLQRITDNKVVQSFLTGNALSTAFSILNLLIYAVVLAFYRIELLVVFAIGSGLYFGWIYLFLRFRRKINYQTFHNSSRENTATLQLIQGMQEIRLNNAEKIKRWEWENIQTSIFKLNLKTLSYSQVQQAGAMLITQGKDIVITFMAAELVIQGDLTLGAMLAIQYIIGQMGSPIEQFVGFVQSAQDARISMERINEVHQLHEEEDTSKTYITHLPEDKTIRLNNLFFTYSGAGNAAVLEDITLTIPAGKITAIVGSSGSGKTTLLKLLMKFYDHYSGEVMIGEMNLRYISPAFWRSTLGAVLQDGFIFNDTIAGNIAVGEEYPDYQRLIRCCKTANILSFIESLPAGLHAMLGAEGTGLSQGQKQRLLIARAVYRDPEYIFFDEATNSLDANNERSIVQNLSTFFAGKTVIVVAHRLSTIRHADKIIVLGTGKKLEEGTHSELYAAEG